MRRCTTGTCSLTLPLITERWQEDRLEKRFELGRKLYNTLTIQMKRKYERLSEQPEFAGIVSRMNELFENGQRDSEEYTRLSKCRTELLKSNGFTEFDFLKAMTPLYKVFNKNIDSNMAQVIAKNVWKAFQGVLYGTAETVHCKKTNEFNCLAGKRERSSIKYSDGKINMTDLTIKVKLNPNNTYEREMLNRRVKFCAVKRIWVRNKYKYLLILVLEGRPAAKTQHPVGNGRVGLYVGMRKVAYVSDKETGLRVLAEGIEKIEQEKKALRLKMQHSLQALNPEVWPKGKYIMPNIALIKSKNYVKLRNRYRDLCRKATEISKIEHSTLANHLLSLGNEFYSNKLDYQAFQATPGKRPKRQKRVPKRRYGEVIGRHSPSGFLQILRRKIENSGQASIGFIDPYTAKVRQIKQSGDFSVERDIYSAFLIQNIDNNLKTVNPQLISENLDGFFKLQSKTSVNL